MNLNVTWTDVSLFVFVNFVIQREARQRPCTIVDKHCEAWQTLVRQQTAGRQTARRQLLLTFADRKIKMTEKTFKKKESVYAWIIYELADIEESTL